MSQRKLDERYVLKHWPLDLPKECLHPEGGKSCLDQDLTVTELCQSCACYVELIGIHVVRKEAA